MMPITRIGCAPISLTGGMHPTHPTGILFCGGGVARRTIILGGSCSKRGRIQCGHWRRLGRAGWCYVSPCGRGGRQEGSGAASLDGRAGCWRHRNAWHGNFCQEFWLGRCAYSARRRWFVGQLLCRRFRPCCDRGSSIAHSRWTLAGGGQGRWLISLASYGGRAAARSMTSSTASRLGW